MENLKESKEKSGNGAHANHKPPTLRNLLVGDTPTKIPCQVSQTVQAVVGEGESEKALQTDLSSDGQTSESSSQRGRLEVPAEQRSGKVGSCEEVKRAGQEKTSDTVSSTTVPGNLRSVDGQVGSDGAAETLLGEELCGIGGLRVGCGESNRVC
jgi:hypothetical protein